MSEKTPQTGMNLLLELMKDVGGWVATPHTVEHTKTGIVVWTANGWTFCKVEEPLEIPLGPISRWRLYRASKRLRLHILERLVFAARGARHE